MMTLIVETWPRRRRVSSSFSSFAGASITQTWHLSKYQALVRNSFELLYTRTGDVTVPSFSSNWNADLSGIFAMGKLKVTWQYRHVNVIISGDFCVYIEKFWKISRNNFLKQDFSPKKESSLASRPSTPRCRTIHRQPSVRSNSQHLSPWSSKKRLVIKRKVGHQKKGFLMSIWEVIMLKLILG